MPTITAADVLNKTMYAKTDIDLYDQTLAKKGTLPGGALIGDVYSYLTDSKTGDIYWMFYRTPKDYIDFNPTYVRHDPSELDLPSYNDLLAAVTDKMEKDKLQSLGPLNYYIQKYAPYLIGAGVLVLVLPTLTKQFSSNKKVSGMQNNDVLKIAAGAALIWYLTKKKRKGSVYVAPLDPGSYGDSAAITNATPIVQQANAMVADNSQLQSLGPTASGKMINFVGPFAVSYKGAAMNGKKRSYVI